MTKVINVNEFTITGVPKFYKEYEFNITLGVQLPDNPNKKYLWCSVDKKGKEKKAPFSEEQFMKAEYVTFVALKMDSYKDKEGNVKHTTKCSNKDVLLNTNLKINMGKVTGVVTKVHPNGKIMMMESPYMGGSIDKKRELKQRIVVVEWLDGAELPAKGAEIFVLGEVRINDKGDPYVKARKGVIL
jgi:hypothetical protein